MHPVLILVLIAVLLQATLAVSASDKDTNSAAAGSDVTKKPTSPFKRQQITNKKLQDIEKEWEEGDSLEELEHEFEHNKKIAAKLNTVNYNDMDLIRKLAKEDPFQLAAGQGQKMCFAELNPRADGLPWDKPTVDKLTQKWQGLIRTASLSAEFYNIDQEKILYSVGKTWMLREISKFVVQQPEVSVVRIDNKDYTKENFEDLADDEDL